jgi:hypothetical protein
VLHASDKANTSSKFQRQRHILMPLTRFGRISAANLGAKRIHQNRTVSWLTSMPRSCRRFSTFRKESGKRT